MSVRLQISWLCVRIPLQSLRKRNTTDRKYYTLAVEIKYYNVKIDGQNLFDQPVKNDLRIYDNMRRIITGQEGDYTTGCLLDYLIIVY